MNQTNLSQIEQTIMQLSVDEQLLLISRITGKLSGKIETGKTFEYDLSEMAKDENIQRELKEIEKDFLYTESDGLEK